MSQLVTFPGGGPISKWFHLATGLLFSLMAVIYLTSGVMMRRYQRRTSAVDTASDSTPRL